MKEKFLSNNILSRKEFLEIREYLRETRLYNPHESLQLSKDYVFALSALEKLMLFDKETAATIYHQINYYKGLAWIQQRNIGDCLNQVTEEGDMSFVHTKETPRIYCTFHIGSYRMPIFKILEKGIDLVLVLASNTLKQQHESLTIAHEEMKKRLGLTNTFSFIDAESPTGAIQMVRALKEGKSLFFYLDGNTGVGGIRRNDEKMIPVSFFDAKIFSRKGVAFIAEKCKVPIVTTLCHYISDDDMKITYYPAINQQNSSDINESSKITTQFIYNNFSEVLKKYPDQWEGWFSLPNFLDSQNLLSKDNESININKDKKYVFDKFRFYHFTYRNTLCLMDKETFQIYPINQDFLNILKGHDEFIYEKNILPENVFEFLVKNEIFIAS